MPRAPKQTITEVQILEISQGTVEFAIIGTMPLILNRMSEKAKRALLMGSTRKNAAEKAATVKHDPVAEFRASAYTHVGNGQPTRLRFPSPGLKGTIKTAALDIPGATKAEMGRRVWVPGTHVNVWGVPKLFMSVVRSADAARTPDIRTRAIVTDWCAHVKMHFVQPLVTPRMITSLFAAGGLLCGIGDWRQEKGSGSFGQFRLCDAQDADFRKIIREGGRAAQDEALKACSPYDAETEELLEFYYAEILRRGREKDKVTIKPSSVGDAPRPSTTKRAVVAAQANKRRRINGTGARA